MIYQNSDHRELTFSIFQALNLRNQSPDICFFEWLFREGNQFDIDNLCNQIHQYEVLPYKVRFPLLTDPFNKHHKRSFIIFHPIQERWLVSAKDLDPVNLAFKVNFDAIHTILNQQGELIILSLYQVYSLRDLYADVLWDMLYIWGKFCVHLLI